VRFIRNQPFAEYQAIVAQNKSLLVEIERSPAHYRYAQTHPRKATPSLIFGRFFHTLILEPHLIQSQYHVVPEGMRAGTKAHDALSIAAQGRELIKARDWELAESMRDALLSHSRAAQCLRSCPDSEVSMIWTDDIGLACKARADKLAGGVIVDVKTCEDASIRGFERAVATYKYHWQAAMYADGYKTITGDDAIFVFVCVEKDAPHGVAVYTLDAEFLEAGRRGYKNALAVVRDCVEKNEWPCYSNEVLEIPAPKWMQ